MYTHFSRGARGAACAAQLTFVLPALLIAVSACEASPAAAVQPNVVSGTVRTTDGRPIAGATIRISGATGAARGTTVRTRSDANGNYRMEVRPGHYDVDAFYDLTFEGQTYRELWLDRTNEGCERQLSDKGIVRHFVLRLSGPLRCSANFDPNEPTSYAGAAVTVVPGNLPAATSVRFTFTPIGALADGTQGRVLTFDRTAAMLARSGGRLGETSWLYDIPLARYRVTAEVTMPGGAKRTLLVRDNAGGRAAAAIELGFPAQVMLPYGMRSASITLVDAAQPPSPPTPGGDDRQPQPPRPSVPGPDTNGPHVGRYECSYKSPYAGEIPNGRTIAVLADGRYQAWGSSGGYSRRADGGIQWSSGPFAQRGVTVKFSEEGGRMVLTVRGGAAAEDPGGINRCVRTGG